MGSEGEWPPFLRAPQKDAEADQAPAFPLLRPETSREQDLGLALPTGPSLPRPFLEKAQSVLVPSSALPPPGALPSAPGLKPAPMARTGPQLLPPSSFVPCGGDAPTQVSPPWSSGLPFFGPAFRAPALGAVATAVLAASGTFLPRQTQAPFEGTGVNSLPGPLLPRLRYAPVEGTRPAD